MFIRKIILRRQQKLTRSVFFSAFVAFFLLSNAHAQIAPLSETRDQIVFAELSPTEKRVLVEQAQLLVKDTYVNRLAKQEFYPGVLDPLAQINNLLERVDDLSTAELEDSLGRIVLSQRDFHFNYFFPAPYGNFVSFLPFDLERVTTRRDPFRVHVSAINADLFEQFSPDQRVPEVGDRVLRYNGAAVRSAVEALIPIGGGANTWGGFKNALGLLTQRFHLFEFLPEENDVEILMQSRATGEHYTISLPWLSVNRLGAARATGTDTMLLSKELEISDQPGPDRFKPSDWKMLDQRQRLRRDLLEFAQLMPKSDYPNQPSNEPVLSWGVIENRYGTFGYMRLDSFVPATGIDGALQEIRRLALEDLRDTDALIFDVRDNGGGFAQLGEALPQLLGNGDVSPTEWRLLNSETNQRLFNEVFTGDTEIVAALNDVAGTDATYSSRFNLFSPNQLNSLGQAYYKPVGILANARSYSATDLFVCSAQDDDIATIYGEDPRTGAGGATVVFQDLFLNNLGAPFEPLPTDHDFRTAWIQAIRTGLNDNQLIEDFGCAADVDVSPVVNDLLTGNENQMLKITRDLARRARSFDYFSQAQALDSNVFIQVDADQAAYSLKTRGTRSVRVYRDGELLDEVRVFSGFSLVDTELNISSYLVSGITNLAFRGVNYRGEESWNLKRSFLAVSIPAVEIDAAGLALDFAVATSPAPLAILNLGASDQGWRLEAPFLQVGFPEYENDVDTEAVLRLDLSQRESASLSLSYGGDTEPGFDFFDIYVTTGDLFSNPINLLTPRSGTLPFGEAEFSLNAYAGQKDVYVHIRFTSDELITGPGVQIGTLNIR